MREPIVAELEQFVEEVLDRLGALEDGLDELNERLTAVEAGVGLMPSDAPGGSA